MTEDTGDLEEDAPEGDEPDDLILPTVHRSFQHSLVSTFGTGHDPGVSLRQKSAQDSADSRVETLRSHADTNERYVLEKEIARGGMGAVLRIFDNDLRRTLAMKVILGRDGGASSNTSTVDPDNLLRFLEEAQITGQLDHPCVVPVHELGVDAEGRVYFTMPLVRGEELTKIIGKVHADDPEWNLTRALGVVLKVCEAMSYAHHKGVVHRDLKPSNVMVGRHGEVYVMDWGIARVEGHVDRHDIRIQSVRLEQSLVHTDRGDARDKSIDAAIMTMDGAVVGTPYYMPPEQAAGRLEEIGPRSDVYALGAMLYHLLTGSMPYFNPGDRHSPHTILAMVCQGPPRPIHELAPAVPAELQSITEKAMARDPAARYADMGEVKADLRAYLEDRVVSAYRTGAIVELKKWVQRNRALAATILITVLLAVGATTTTSVVMSAKNKEIQKAKDESDSAAETSQRVTDFLAGQYELLDPDKSGDASITAVELLNRAARSIDGDMQDEPLLAARLRNVVGTALLSLGQPERAELLLQRAVEDRRMLLGPEHPETLQALDGLATAQMRQGRYTEAEPLYKRVLEERTATLSPGHPDVRDSVASLAYFYQAQGRYTEAEPLFVRALDSARAQFGENGIETAVSMNNLALLYKYQNHLDKAQRLNEQALSIFEERLSPRHPFILDAQVNLADIYREQRNDLEAEKLLLQALEGFRSSLGGDHPSTLITLAHLGYLRYQQGRFDDAEQLYTQTLERLRATGNAEEPDALGLLHKLGDLYRIRRRFEEAEKFYIQALEKGRKIRGDDHENTLVLLDDMLLCYAGLLPARRESFGADDPRTLAAMHTLGTLNAQRGSKELAEELLVECLDQRFLVLGESDARSLETMHALGVLYAATGRLGDAEGLLEECLEKRRVLLGKAAPATLLTEQALTQLRERE